MTDHPVRVAWALGTHPGISQAEEQFFPFVAQAVSDITTRSLDRVKLALLSSAGAYAVYEYDPTNTEAEDGITVIHDSEDRPFVRRSSAIPAGGFVPRGSYAGGTTYSLLDLVENQNSSWVYINATPGAGNAPPTLPTKVNSYWLLIAQQGATGSATSSADLAWSGDISPTQITADQNDYNPSGLSAASEIRHDIDGHVAITSLQGGADGRVMMHTNLSATDFLTLPGEHPDGAAANRFEQTIIVPPRQTRLTRYDATLQRWRAVGDPISAALGMPRNNKVCMFGDSRTNNSWQASSFGYSMNGYVGFAAAYAGQIVTFDEVDEVATGGWSTADLLANIDDVLASDAASVVVWGGANDRNATNDMTLAQSIANMTAILDLLAGSKDRVYLITETPRAGAISAAQTVNHRAFHRWLKTGAPRLWPSIIPVNVYDDMVDPASAVFAPLDDYAYDDLHMTAAGNAVIGQAVANAIIDYHWPSEDLSNPPITNSDGDQLATNGLLEGTGGTKSGGPTGDVADNWTLQSANDTGFTVVGSKGVNQFGDVEQIITISGTPADANSSIILTQNITSGIPATGNLVRARARVKVDSGATGLLRAHVQVTSTGGTTTRRDSNGAADNGAIPSGGYDVVMMTPKMPIQSGITALIPRVQIGLVQSVPVSAVIRVSRLKCWDDT